MFLLRTMAEHSPRPVFCSLRSFSSVLFCELPRAPKQVHTPTISHHTSRPFSPSVGQSTHVPPRLQIVSTTPWQLSSRFCWIVLTQGGREGLTYLLLINLFLPFVDASFPGKRCSNSIPNSSVKWFIAFDLVRELLILTFSTPAPLKNP